jgi:hypothetical protein
MIKAEEMMPKARAKRVKAEKPSEMRALPVME